MSVEIKLPSLGEGIETADVAEVLVQAGDTVEAGQVLMELETDKAVVPVPSEQAGVIESINVSQGETIAVGQVIATLEGASKETETQAKPEKPSAAPTKESVETPPPKPQAPLRRSRVRQPRASSP